MPQLQKTKHDPVESFFGGMYKNSPDPVSCGSYQPNSRQRKRTASLSGKNEKKPFVSSLLKAKENKACSFLHGNYLGSNHFSAKDSFIFTQAVCIRYASSSLFALFL
ncbi:MAG: hypothetical protein CDV28_13821 [Candidatus Electronema aureum]|uniref:Uncharacterized protein n=1 Tax=Candidatus Electronema aureum TaxID=2005002 RepID=A0A521FZE6_9BACT|nr:MAG: hypothetical protein CDV28_13821 [Candidatus Electronema aureum]